MNTNVTRRLVQVFLTLFIQGVILFVAAGTLFWKWAWILLLLSVVILIINLLVIPVELIEERGRVKNYRISFVIFRCNVVHMVYDFQ